MKQPCEYQKDACPLLHASPVTLAHGCVFTSTRKSTELRDRGETSEPWPWTELRLTDKQSSGRAYEEGTIDIL